MAESDGVPGTANDLASQIASMKEQINSLIEDRAKPMLSDARDSVMDRADDLSDEVRAHPLASIAVVAFIGFILGRIAR